jgi:hypothetical protein
MQEASAKGKSAQFKDRGDAVAPDRPETWLIGSAAETAKAPNPQPL